MKKFEKKEEERKSEPYGFALGMNLVPEVPIQWLWPGRIVMENLTLLVGDPNVGKSSLALDLAARVTRGADWPDGTPGGEPKSVLMVSAEDHAYFSVRPALAAAGADMDKIASVWDVREEYAKEDYRWPLELPNDFGKLRKMIKDRSDCKLVVIDPITAFVRGGMHHRNTLMRLVMLACDLHVAVLGVAHLRPGGMRAMYRTQGGIALTSTARAVWLAVDDHSEFGQRRVRRKKLSKELSVVGCQLSENQQSKGQQSEVPGTRRLLLPVKNNLVRESTGLAYRLEPAEGRLVPRVDWEQEKVRQTADQALALLARPRGPDLRLREQAMEYLKETLAKGPRLVKEVELEAEILFQIKRRTLERARKALGIQTFRLKASGSVWMKLPDVQPDEDEMREKPGEHGGQAENPGNHGTFSQDACPPSGGQGGVIGGQGTEEERGE